ncbi:centrosomal protein CCDC61 isoform X2 [Patella vulgata]|uniref:centrosomal protein CCDC61 isoform X2 n=1 Tax=Patella vulgata TaxID=6465 RepID=UPI0021808A20|nr:centrosomal protein CCDC61 isoform X2 [Patella vulgata]
MMESPTDIKVTSSCLFRGSEYIVTMEVKDGEELFIEVEDRLTSDQWKASFDATYVQDLTHKTGNFKQFHIFTSMLESALNKNSDTVSLDLLTFADLESLRARKSGTTSQSIPGSRHSTLNSKRYLILTYTVEFDRIHYPLPLPYVGKPDPRTLQESLRHLQTENRRLKDTRPSDYRSKDYDKLQRDYNKLLKEKENIEEELFEMKRQMKVTSNGSTAKDVRMLKGIVRNLEEELMKEKNKYQRSTSKRGQEYRELLGEVEELRASERNLRVRVKSLTNELAIYKRDRAKVGQRSFRPASRERSGERFPSIGTNRSLSRERPPARGRSTSRDRPSSAPNRSRLSDRSPGNSFMSSRSRISDKSPVSQRNYRSRTPSPAGSRGSRFDPSAYVKEKERLMKEAKLKAARQNRSNISGGSARLRPSPNRNNNSQSSVTGRNRSRNSSLGSQGDFSDTGATSDSSTQRYSKRSNSRSKTRTSRTSTYLTSPNMGRSNKERHTTSRKPRVLASTPESDCGRTKSVRNKDIPDKEYGRRRTTRKKGDYTDSTSDKDDDLNCSDEISEIDDRLNRLQELMKTSLG